MLDLKNLRPGEKVLLVVRRHWIVFVMLGVYFLLGIILSLIIFTILGFRPIGFFTNILLWFCFSIFLYIDWLNHELDMYVVTNNRVIGIEQISFLNRSVSEANLGQVQEVNSKTKGLFANIFNYGTIKIQTAGNKTTLSMDYAPEAMEGSRKILNIVDDYRDKSGHNANKQV